MEMPSPHFSAAHNPTHTKQPNSSHHQDGDAMRCLAKHKYAYRLLPRLLDDAQDGIQVSREYPINCLSDLGPYISLLCSSWILYHLHASPAGKPSWVWVLVWLFDTRNKAMGFCWIQLRVRLHAPAGLLVQFPNINHIFYLFSLKLYVALDRLRNI